MSGRTETIVNKSNSSHTISESSPRVAGLTIQTSSYGLTIPIIYGRSRIAPNLLWVGNFYTQTISETTVTSSTPEQVTTTRTGKFGKKTTTITPASQTTQTTITYVYWASPVFSLGEGPIAGLHAMWREKTKLGPNGWGEFFTQNGAIGQSALSFLGDQTINYSGLALSYANGAELTSGGGLPAFSFEVNGKLQGTGDGVNANPADIIVDLATNPAYGAGFVATPFADITGFRNYCRAMGLFISPCYDTQQPLAQIVQELCAATNSAIFSSQGLLKIIPYADTQVTGNGATYTPVTTPLYDLDDNDFLDFVKCDRRTPADCFNSVRVEYLDAAQDYAIAIAEAFDQAHIEANGARPMEPVKSHGITNSALARKVAQILLQRQLYVINEYTFPLPWNYALLEPMDLVTLTDEGLGFNKLPVRVTGVEEDAEGNLSITAEDYPFGIASVTLYPDHPGLAISVDYNANPGNVLAPHFFEPPIEFTTETLLDVRAAVTGSDPVWGGCQVWFSLDGDEYRNLGTINGGSIYGHLTAPLFDSGDVSVSLVGRGGQLLNIPMQDVQNLASLCWVEGTDSSDGGEFFAYETASLTGVNAYTLGGLVRGAYSSNQRAKAVGAKFARLDANIASSGKLQRSIIGQPTYWKFTSFNKYGGGQQSLVDAVEYTYTPTGNMALLPPSDVPSLEISGKTLSWQTVVARDLAGYILRFNYGSNPAWSTATPINSGVITQSPFDWTLRPAGAVTVLIKAVDTTGNESVQATPLYTDLGDPAIANIVEELHFHPAFAGTLTSCIASAGALLADSTTAFYPAGNQPMYPSGLQPFYPASQYSAMQYETERVPINSGLAGSLLTILLDYAGDALLIEYRVGSQEPAFGGDEFEAAYLPETDPFFGEDGPWQLWPGQITAQQNTYQFRITIGSGEVQGRVDAFTLVIDAPDMEETIDNLPLDIGGTVLPYTKPFTVIKGIQATLQSGTSGAVNILTNKTNPLAPVVTAVNSSLVAVAGASGDFTLKGY